ncbi:MAG: hypothetical protein JSW59_04275 [Phycisphaerales bacterium]|nr:MAG: hypothetical protein JSW59_04275 [Phycisphaerales bacterium]
MKMLRWWLVVLLMVCLAGCEKYVLSLEPLCTDESCVSVSGLEGKWASEDQVWTIRSKETAGYEVRVADVLSAARFDGRARRIGDHVFFELKPVKESEDLPMLSLFAAHWLQASSFMQMKLEGNAMRLARMNAGELQKKLLKRPGLIKHVIKDDNIVLLDETKALVQFVEAHADVNELWQEHGEFIRCAPLYSTGDLIQSDGLAGCWLDPNDSDSARIDIRAEDSHFRIEITSNSDERMTFSAHVFKIQTLSLMGIFVGSEDMRSREMASRLPDWYVLTTLENDKLNLSMLDFMEVKDLLAHPEKAQEIQGKPDVKLTRVEP